MLIKLWSFITTIISNYYYNLERWIIEIIRYHNPISINIFIDVKSWISLSLANFINISKEWKISLLLLSLFGKIVQTFLRSHSIRACFLVNAWKEDSHIRLLLYFERWIIEVTLLLTSTIKFSTSLLGNPFTKALEANFFPTSMQHQKS